MTLGDGDAIGIDIVQVLCSFKVLLEQIQPPPLLYIAMNVEDIIRGWEARLSGDPGLVSQIGIRFNLAVNGDSNTTWHFDCANSPAQVSKGSQKAPLTVEIASKDLDAIASGGLNPQKAYQLGKIRLEGEADQALRLYPLFGN